MYIGGRQYALTLAPDLAADGMLLELDDVTDGGRENVADVLYSDQDGTFAFTAYRDALPLAAVEFLAVQARLRLPPVVAIVVDPTYGERLDTLAARMPAVWIADTPANRAAAERIWATAAGAGDRVTTFRVDPAGGPAAWAVGVLDAVLAHHAGDGPHPRAGAVEILGAGLEPGLAAALASAGFVRIAEMPDGIRAGVV